MILRTEIADILRDPRIGAEITVMGWVRAFRSNRFIALNDGSGAQNFQVVVPDKYQEDPALEPVFRKIGFHACIKATGKLVESQGAGQSVELQADTIEILGENKLDIYPLQPKKQTMEFLRENAHFRMRTSTFSSVFRIRHAVAYAIHKYYNDRGFYYMHSPIITGSDAEGAGEMFRVTTLDVDNPPRTPDGAVNWKEDFFGKSTNLTVSGQLQGEIAALAIGKVYTAHGPGWWLPTSAPVRRAPASGSSTTTSAAIGCRPMPPATHCPWRSICTAFTNNSCAACCRCPPALASAWPSNWPASPGCATTSTNTTNSKPTCSGKNNSTARSRSMHNCATSKTRSTG